MRREGPLWPASTFAWYNCEDDIYEHAIVGMQARLLQTLIAQRLRCEVLINSDDAELWHDEAIDASRGVILLQTRRVLSHPLRLLQLHVASKRDHPLVCVKILGGGYDFDGAKRFLQTLPSALPPHDLAALRNSLEEDGAELGQLVRRLSSAVPNSISVHCDPGAELRVQSVATCWWYGQRHAKRAGPC